MHLVEDLERMTSNGTSNSRTIGLHVNVKELIISTAGGDFLHRTWEGNYENNVSLKRSGFLSPLIVLSLLCYLQAVSAVSFSAAFMRLRCCLPRKEGCLLHIYTRSSLSYYS